MATTLAPKPNSKPILYPVKVDDKKRVILKGDARKPRWWRVNVGKKLTGTKKERRFFDTEGEAKEFIRNLETARKTKGHSAFSIPERLAVEAATLAEKLQTFGVSLTTAVDFFIRHAPQGTKKTVSELLPAYLSTKENPRYRYAQQTSLNVFGKDFGSKPIASIFAPALEDWFKRKKWKPLNLRNYMRDLSMFFKWAVGKDYIGSNPLDKIERPAVARKTPDIFTVEETRRLLETASLHPKLGLLPMYAIGLFAGVRVEELERMKWEMVDYEEGELRLPGEITKTGAPRNISIDPALKAVLTLCVETKGNIVSPKNLRLRKERLLKLAKVASRRNALRHSFSTYHAAKHRNPGALQLILGQETPSVLFKHYIAAVRQVDAERYFKLRPPFASQQDEERVLPSPSK